MLLNFVKLGGLQLCEVTISWVEIFLDGNFPGGNYPGWELSGWELSWVGIFFGGSFLGGNCPMAIIRVEVFMLPETSSQSHFLSMNL